MSKLNVVFMGMNSRYSKIPLIDLSKEHNIVAIVESAPRKYRKSLRFRMAKNTRDRLSMISKKRHSNLEDMSLCELAEKLEAPYYYCSDINTVEMVNELEKANPDVICVASLSQLMNKDIISIPKNGVLNVHPSLLPLYRGPNPWFWHYYNMEKYGGVTVHYIDEGEDTGNIIYQERYEIPLGMLSEEMWDKAIAIGSALLCKAVDDISTYSVSSVIQKESVSNSRARNVKENEKIVDWENWDVEHIYHVLRGTFTWLRAIKGVSSFVELKVIGYEKCDVDKDKCFGQRYRENSKELVYCKDGVIFIETKRSLKVIIKRLVMKLANY